MTMQGLLYSNRTKVFEKFNDRFVPLINSKVMILPNNIVWFLEKTKNQEYLRKLPFNSIFIDCLIKHKTLNIFGILISEIEYKIPKKTFNYIHKDYKAEANDLDIFFIGEDSKDDTVFYRNFFLINTKYQELIMDNPNNKFNLDELNEGLDNKIKMFVCNFLDFLNDPEVKIVTVERDEKRNKKRILHNKMPIPERKFIKITGQLKIYLDKLNSGAIRKIDHKFWVRGHFRTLRSEFWKNKRGIRIWIPPFIKGQGILIKRKYIVKKDGDENDNKAAPTA